MAEGKVKKQRLFVALLPDKEVRDSLDNIQTKLKLSEFGSCTVYENLHVTLNFVGEVEAEQVEDIAKFIHNISFAPVEFELNRVGYFARAQIVWAGSKDRFVQLEDLATVIQKGIPFRRKSKGYRGFTPHVTLARNVHKRISQPIDPVSWHINRCYLVRSITRHTGAEYEVIAESEVMK